jgi:hypothetical protein
VELAAVADDAVLLDNLVVFFSLVYYAFLFLRDQIFKFMLLLFHSHTYLKAYTSK